jgi:hypothetical protein
MEDEMSMLSLQTDQLRELAYEVQEGEEVSERELIDALRGAAETIEDLILKHEAADKVKGIYPDGTLLVEVNDLDSVKRVVVEAKEGRLCRQIYEEAKILRGGER